MIICSVCDSVLYFGTMPASCSEVEILVCATCAFDEAANEYENMAYDYSMDR